MPVPALGGRRGKANAVAPEVNGFWRNASLHHYAAYALTDPFHAGLEELRGPGHERRTAIKCSEAVWWRCYRRIIADYLIASGETVFHVLGPGRNDPARLTGGAAVQADGTVCYPTSPLDEGLGGVMGRASCDRLMPGARPLTCRWCQRDGRASWHGYDAAVTRGCPHGHPLVGVGDGGPARTATPGACSAPVRAGRRSPAGRPCRAEARRGCPRGRPPAGSSPGSR